MSGLILPTRAKPSGYASFGSHTRRSPKSTEPGTDIFVPIGTEIIAPGRGRIYASGNTIGPMTGRWVGIDLDDGRRFRTMHHKRNVRTSGIVEQGEVFAISGASGYGYEDWSRLPGMPGPHFHATLWPTHASRYGYDRNGNPYSIDLMENIGGSAAGGNQGASDMPFNTDDINVLNGLGQSIIDQVLAAVRPDLNTVHMAVIGGEQRTRADVNFIHVLSPVSLKRIFETQTGAVFTDAQLEAIGDQLAAASVAGIEAALRDDFDGVKERLAQLPAETIEALKSAL